MQNPDQLSEEDGQAVKPKILSVRTIGVQDFTRRELFARCSGSDHRSERADGEGTITETACLVQHFGQFG